MWDKVMWDNNVWLFIWLFLMIYIVSMIINIVGSWICGHPNFEDSDYKKYDIIKVKWNSNNSDDLYFQIKVVFIPLFNTFCSLIFIVALIVNSIAKFISNK